MESKNININTDELENLIRGVIREELNKINEISDDEQKELEKLHGKSLEENDYNKDNCIRL